MTHIVVAATYRTSGNAVVQGHVLADNGHSVQFLEKGNPNPYWVTKKRVTINEAAQHEEVRQS